MVRIDRNFTINVTFEQFTTGYLKWLPTRPQTEEPEPYIAKTSTGNPAPTSIDIYGELVDLLDLKSYVEDRGVEFVINPGGAINPEPVPDVIPPPTQDEIDSQQFFKDSFNAEFAAMEQIVLAAIKVRYDAVNTTPIAFEDVPKSDIKYLRQRL